MLSSLYSGISGLLANSQTLNVVGNNIANVNTVGYKAASTIFSDVLYQTVSAGSGSAQVGRGSSLSDVRTDFSQGSFETTTSGTDLAIGGSGFFIVKKDGSDSSYYTRAGSFSLDSDGYMVDTNGDILQGKVIDSATGTAYGVDTDIIVSQEPSQPKATSEINMQVNLQSNADFSGTISIDPATTQISGVSVTSGSSPATGNYSIASISQNTDADGNPDGTYAVTITLPDGTTTVTGNASSNGTVSDFGGCGLNITFGDLSTTPPSGAFTLEGGSNYSSSIMVYDSLGTAHTVTISFRKSTEESDGQAVWEWNASVSGDDTVGSGGSGTLTFNNNGVLVAGDLPQSVTFDFAGAAPGQVIDLSLAGSTQYSTSSKTSSQSQDGYPPGTLESISVSGDGIISGTYDNGQIIQLYQITLATFNNPDGLKKEGNNLYTQTLESGYAYTTTPGEGGTGALSSNSLEQSNVDLAAEFVRMIVAQRGYEASSKVITTTDEVLQTLMNLKR